MNGLLTQPITDIRRVNEFKAEMCEFRANREPAVYSLYVDMIHVKKRLDRVKNRLESLELEF